jgi:hypothetical protein
MQEFKMQIDFFNAVIGKNDTMKLKEVELYRELIFNRFLDSFEHAFPYTKEVLGDEKFKLLVEDYVKEHHPRQILWQEAKGLVDFIIKNDWRFKRELPFIDELVYYEWLEIELSNEDDTSNKTDFSWNDIYKINKTARLNIYEYPVHKYEEMEINEIIKNKSRYNLLIFREPKDFEIKTVELTDFVYQILDEISSGITPMESLKTKDLEIDYEEIIPYLENFFSQLTENKVLVDYSS